MWLTVGQNGGKAEGPGLSVALVNAGDVLSRSE